MSQQIDSDDEFGFLVYNKSLIFLLSLSLCLRPGLPVIEYFGNGKIVLAELLPILLSSALSEFEWNVLHRKINSSPHIVNPLFVTTAIERNNAL